VNSEDVSTDLQVASRNPNELALTDEQVAGFTIDIQLGESIQHSAREE
jgi:hypothetical protein